MNKRYSLRREILKAVMFLGASLIGRGAEGPILIDPEHPHSFRYASGERFFPMGDTAYYLIAQPKEVIARYFRTRREHRFNFIRAMASADGFWPFGGTPGKPQYGVITEDALRKWDWVFDCAAENGMNLELILFGYGTAGGEGLWASADNQDLWIRTLVNRFKNRGNLLMFTIANEFERYPDGKYEYQPSDVDWARKVAARIRELDPVHPIGCHPSVWITDQDPPGKSLRPFGAYNGFTQRRPQVVWPLWRDSQVNLNVTQNNEGVQSRAWGDPGGQRRGLSYFPTAWQGINYHAQWTTTGWDFEAPGLEDCVAEDWPGNKPVLNLEFGYQYEPGCEGEMEYLTRQCHQPATVRRKAWKIAAAGGCFGAGYISTAVRRIFTEQDVDNFRPRQLEVLYDFFTSKTSYWKMTPHLELVAPQNALLALPGSEYIAYFPRGGSNHIDLVTGAYQVEWLHAETGRYYEAPGISVNGGRQDFAPPVLPGDDWVLHLRQKD